MIKAVIFDLDDTLISEKQYIESGFKHISNLLSKRFGLDDSKLYQLLIQLFMDSPKNVFNRMYDSLGITYHNNEIIDLVNEYRNHLPKIEFFEDVFECLKGLKKCGLKTGIITDGYAVSQRNKLKALKANKYFDGIIVTDELGREYWKPHPKPFELIRKNLNVEFNEMIYIGDNPEKDFYISAIYPVKTIRILRDGVYRNKSYLKNIKETYSIQRLSELNRLIFEESNTQEAD